MEYSTKDAVVEFLKGLAVVVILDLMLGGSMLIVARAQSGPVAQSSPVFELTDGYFQAGGRRPIHIVHGFTKQTVWLGDSIRIWYSVALLKDQKSPCDEGSSGECVIKLSFSSSTDSSKNWTVRVPTRISSDEGSYGHGFTLDREKTPKGDGRYTISLEKDDKLLFSFGFPVEVK